MTDSAWTPEKVAVFREEYFAFRKHVFINSKEKGRICLGENTYRSQTMLLDGIFEALSRDIHDVKVLKSRQLGITTESRALTLFWNGIFEGRGYMVFDTDAHKEEARLELLAMIENLPSRVDFPRIKRQNRTLLELKNGSVINFASAGVKESSSSGTLGRSSGISYAHCSELCSWSNTEGLESFKNALAEDNPNRLYVWESPIALDTPIPVPGGWTTIGKIKEGHHVYGQDGKIVRVSGVSPIFVNRKCYKINFSNGDSIVADGSHKWQVMERRWPTNPQWKSKIVKTEEIDIQNHRIEVSKPLEMPDIWLPVDPYFLGVWLGDGTSDQAAITTGDEDIDEMRELLSQRGCALGPISKKNWRVGKFTVLGHRKLFNRIGLTGNKHIPPVYFRASESQRRELLAGLMDTDGHISPKNFQCTFANTSMRLIDDVAELLSSLGIKFKRSVCSIEGKLRTFPNGKTYACSYSERLVFHDYPEYQVFNLSRKKSIQNGARGERSFTYRKAKYLKITSIEEVPSVPVRCLSVDNKSHLFLVGKTMIPTHNTARGFNAWHDMWMEAKQDPTHQKTIFLGFWSKDNQKIDQNHRDFERYGTQPPTQLEKTKIAEVEELYGWRITPEQLAWIRRKMDPTAQAEGDAPAEHINDPLRVQEQPFTEFDSFQMTAATFFDAEKLTEQAKKNATQKFKTYSYSTGIEFVDCRAYPAHNAKSVQLKVWEPPEVGATYIIAADPAFGENERNDRSAIQVIRGYSDGIDQVAEFAWPTVNTRQFGWVIASLLGWYGMEDNEVFHILELNGPGSAVWNELQSLKQQIQYAYQPKQMEERGLQNIFQNVRNYIYTRSDSMSPGKNWQFKTSGPLKVQIMERLRDFTENGMARWRSLDLLEEMECITRSGDSIKGEGSNKDDRVVAAALAIRCWEERARRNLMILKKTRDSEAAKKRLTIRDQITQFNTSQIDQFFAVKKITRQRARALALKSWRSR